MFLKSLSSKNGQQVVKFDADTRKIFSFMLCLDERKGKNLPKETRKVLYLASEAGEIHLPKVEKKEVIGSAHWPKFVKLNEKNLNQIEWPVEKFSQEKNIPVLQTIMNNRSNLKKFFEKTHPAEFKEAVKVNKAIGRAIKI